MHAVGIWRDEGAGPPSALRAQAPAVTDGSESRWVIKLQACVCVLSHLAALMNGCVFWCAGRKTLAEASKQSVDGLLAGRGKSRSRRQQAAATAMGHASGDDASLAPCGAEAALPEAERPERERRPEEELVSEGAAATLGSTWNAVPSNESDGEWEEIEAMAVAADDGTVPQEGSGDGFSVEIEGEAARGGSRRRQRGISKADRAAALLLHRSHLLCLVARGIACSAATADLELQAQLLSCLPNDVIQANMFDERSGPADGSVTASGADAVSCTERIATLDGVRSALSWFTTTFRLMPGGGTGNGTPLGAMHGVRRNVVAALHARGGSAESVTLLWIATLRALGYSTRLVQALEPMPARPGQGRDLIGCGRGGWMLSVSQKGMGKR